MVPAFSRILKKHNLSEQDLESQKYPSTHQLQRKFITLKNHTYFREFFSATTDIYFFRIVDQMA